jgi:pimeloyl-ACP methyl ester carboxylesterase
VLARGVDFHVTQAGPHDGTPVLALHGWPQHHYEYRDLLARPPEAMRIIAPDLPGYGWSGPPSHRWEKEEVASDVLALLDELGLRQVVLVGHDWGGYIGHLMALRAPERFSAFLSLNIAHPWNTLRTVTPHIWRFLLYQPAIAITGVPVQRYTPLPYWAVRYWWAPARSGVTSGDIRWFTDRLRDPVCAITARDTYRTFWRKEIPSVARHPQPRRSRVPTRAVFGVADPAVHWSLASPRTAKADDYSLELIADCGHFIVDERPDVVRDRLVGLAARFPPS